MALHKKKPLELVFNLLWINEDDKVSEQNIIGMVDTLLTTLSFEKFKSYLLKNSGVATDDIKVTYVNNKSREWVINSEERFEAALLAFRLKARSGEKINLKLERISNTGAIKRTNSVRTQCTQVCNNETPPEWFISYMEQFKTEIMEQIKRPINPKAAPKTTVVLQPQVQEISTNNTDENLFNNVNHYKKLKKQRKLLHNHHHHHQLIHINENQIDKELMRTLKYDRKLEIKLDKLDAKTKKIKEKKQALINKLPVEIVTSDNGNKNDDNKDCKDDEHNGKDDALLFYENGQPLMDAAVVMDLPNVKHMCGGEVYSHTWNIVNKGKLSFTDKTELRWTWGSAELKPETKNIKLPLLNPGETGSIKVTFQIPTDGGKYESYWNFYHGEFRFGSWLSCTIIVDPPPELPELVFPTIVTTPSVELNDESKINVPQLETASIVTLSSKLSSNSDDDNVQIDNVNTVDGKSEHELTKKMDNLLILKSSDWEDDENDNSFEKVIIYGISEEDLIVDLSKKDETTSNKSLADEIKDADSKPLNQDDNNNNTSDCIDNNGLIHSSSSSSSSHSISSYDLIHVPDLNDADPEGTDFVFVEIQGNRIPLPRNIINPELLKDTTAKEKEDESKAIPTEELAESNNFLTTVEHFAADLDEFKSFISHCSTAGTNFSDTNPTITANHSVDETTKDDSNNRSQFSSNESRLFIFPQNNPGFEVVKPEENFNSEKIFLSNNVEVSPIEPQSVYSWSQSQTQYTLADVRNRSVLEKFDPYRPEQQTEQPQQPPKPQQFEHLPNYQQTPRFTRKSQSTPNQQKSTSPPSHRPIPSAPVAPNTSTNSGATKRNGKQSQTTTNPTVPVNSIPENLVNGAVNVASSAINTARSVINMMIPPKTEPGRWVDGHWVTDIQESKRAKNIRLLVEMGFWDIDYNATLLARYNDDLNKVINELLQ